MALLLIAMRITDLLWITVPEFQNRHGHVDDHTIRGLVFYLAAVLGVGGIWFWWFFGQLRQRSLLPLKDPQLAEALAAGGHH